MSAPISKTFSLTPSHHCTNDVLYFNDKYDIKYYLGGAKTLFSECEDKFKCTPKNLNIFYKLWMRYLRSMNGTNVAQESPGAIGVS